MAGMNNQIEKILCVELLEKISRMRRYLHSHYSSSKTEGKEVVTIFNSALDATQFDFEKVINYVKVQDVLTPVEQATVSRRISNVFFTISNLHQQLQLIYGEWVRPETHTFLKEIINFFPSDRRKEKINIVLTNDYMFSEDNLTSLFAEILNDKNATAKLVEENPTVFLPKIDYDNPLNWTILAHECGHTDLKGIQKLLNNTKLLPTHIIGSDRTILENWVEEIYCDLIATKVLGPAYLASFSTFVLLLSGIKGNEDTSQTHPSNVLRINLMQEYLESKNISIPISESYLDNSDLSSYYYYMIESYNETSRKYLNPRSSPLSTSIDTTQLLDTISEEVDEIVNLDLTLSIDDFKRINSLKGRLVSGITIGSFHDIEKLSMAREKYQLANEDEIGLNELNYAKDSLQETRTKLWEIINTGWINKVENILPKSISLFFDNDKDSFIEKMETFSNDLEKYDSILLKSIESSEIFKIMEEGN